MDITNDPSETTIDELIIWLQGLKKEHGNLPVYRADNEYGADPVGNARYIDQGELGAATAGILIE